MPKFNLYILYLICLVCFNGCFCPHRFTPRADPLPPPCICVPERIRVALVLGSGGVRGMAHVGVIEVLEEAGIPIDVIVGCSAGSIVGALYADNPCAQKLKKSVSQLKSNYLLDFDIWNCRYGLCQGKTMRAVLDKNLQAETFEELQIPLIVVASDLHSTELVTLASGDLVKAVEASCAIPFVFVPVEIDGRILVDGGTINPNPVWVALDLEPEMIIAVDLCEVLAPTFPTNLFSVFWRSAEIAFMWQNEGNTREADIVIRPQMCNVGAFNDQAKEKLYYAGRQAAEEALPAIREALAKHSCMDTPCSTATRKVQLKCYHPKDSNPHY